VQGKTPLCGFAAYLLLAASIQSAGTTGHVLNSLLGRPHSSHVHDQPTAAPAIKGVKLLPAPMHALTVFTPGHGWFVHM
jgi:hypothetical protein